MNVCEENECIAPKSISIWAGVLEIDSSYDIIERFPSAYVLVSVNTQALAFSYFTPFSKQSLMKCPFFTFETCSCIGSTFPSVNSSALIALWFL